GISPYFARSALGNAGAEIENHEVVHQSNNKAHVMLHEQDAHAVCPQFSKKRRKLLLFAMAQPRRWFVQQKNGRVERKSARDFENAHLPESKVPGGAVLELRQPHALQLAHGFAEKGGFLRTLQAKNAFQHAAMSALMRAECHVFQHAHAGKDLRMLEGSCHALGRNLAR